MAPQTIFSLLSQPNPTLLKHFPKSTTNTKVEHPITILSITEWADFTYEKLIQLFPWVETMQISYELPKFVQYESFVSCEDSLEMNVLARDPFPAVNKSFETIMAHLSTSNKSRIYPTLQYIRGSQADVRVKSNGKEKPDWGFMCLLDNFSDSKFPFRCEMIGDTKISSKWTWAALQEAWQQSLHDGQISLALDNLLEPVRQIAGYVATTGRKYAFIQTDWELVLLEFASPEPGAGIASTRPRRTQTRTQRFSVESTVRSLDRMSLETTSEYQPELDYDMLVRGKSILWETFNDKKQKKKKQLTVRLGLLFQGLIAAFTSTGELDNNFTTDEDFAKVKVKNSEKLIAMRKQKEREVQAKSSTQVSERNYYWNEDQHRYYYVESNGEPQWCEVGWVPPDNHEELDNMLEDHYQEVVDLEEAQALEEQQRLEEARQESRDEYNRYRVGESSQGRR